MKKTAKHLYISDLDGTLLQSDALPSAESVALLNQMMDDGLAFTVASARNLLAIRQVLPGLRLRLPIIELNGAFLTDPSTGAHIMRNTLPAGLARQLLDELYARDIHPVMNTWGDRAHLYYHRLNSCAMQDFIGLRRRQNDPRLRDEPNFYRVVDSEDVVCLSLLEPPDKLAALRAHLDKQYAGQLSAVLYRDELPGGYRHLALYAHNAQKSVALAEFAALCGYDRADITVFGDDTNDLPMFGWAGRAVAVGNAVAAVKAAAHLIIGPNDESAVARFIRDEFYAR